MTIPPHFPLEREAYVPARQHSGALPKAEKSDHRIIDFHSRPPTPEVLAMFSTPVWKGLGEWLSPKLDRIPIDDYVSDLRAAGIWRGVFSGRDIESTFGFRLPNEHVADVCARFPDFFIGVGGVDPNKRREGVREVGRIADLGLKGVSLDPYFQGLPADDRLYYPILAECIERNLFVMVTTGPAPRIREVLIEHGHPRQIDRIARDLPELTIIVRHGCYPWPAELLAVVNKQPNVFFEWSAYETQPLADIYVQGANSVTPDRALFAGLSPFTPIRETLETYGSLGLTREAWKRMTFENPYRLLSQFGVFTEPDGASSMNSQKGTGR